MGKIKMMKCSRELAEIVDFIRAKYVLAGKAPPPVSKITSVIARRIKKEELLKNEFIKF